MQSGHRQLRQRQQRAVVTHQCSAVTFAGDSPFTLTVRRIRAEAMHGASGQCHARAARIGTVDNLCAIANEDTLLGFDVVIHAVVAVQMVFRHIQHGRRIGIKACGTFQLKARQFEHKHLGRLAAALRRVERLEYRGADIAGDDSAAAGGDTDIARHLCHRAFTVGTGDGNHAWPHAHLTQRLRQ